MSKLTKILSVVCSASLIFSIPSISLANLEEKVANIHRNTDKERKMLSKKLEDIEKDVVLKKEKLDFTEKEIENLQKEIDNILKKSDTDKVSDDVVSKINSKKGDLEKEKKHCNECREVLDGLTAVLLSDEKNEKDEELLLSKTIAQENFDKASKQVQELESELEKLEISKHECKDLKSELEKLIEKKQQFEQNRNKLKEEIEQSNKKHDEIFAKREGLKEEADNLIKWLNVVDQRNKISFQVWNRILSGNQNENNVLDGQKIEKTCGIFAATNIINYFRNSTAPVEKPIRGFNDVIKFYLSHGGKKENLNKILGCEELKEYLESNIANITNTIYTYDIDDNITDKEEIRRLCIKKDPVAVKTELFTFRINTYDLSYEERISNIPDLKKEMQKQIKNVKDFLIAHFRLDNFKWRVAPVLNLNNGHWQTFVALDEIDRRILLVDSSTDKAEWVDLDAIAKSVVSVQDGKLHWSLLFSGCNGFKSNSDYFGIDLGNPLTDKEKKRIVDLLNSDLI